MKNSTPGVHESLTFADYARINALNHHGLEDFRRNPAFYRYKQAAPPEDSDALRMGGLFHALALESPRFTDLYAVRPEANKASNAGLIKLIEWAEETADLNPRTETGEMKQAALKASLKAAMEGVCRTGREIVSHNEMEFATSLMQAAHRHPGFAKMLYQRDARKELSVVAEVDGIMRKARADLYLPGPKILLDLKTTRHPIDPVEFAKQSARLGYHRQAAFYRRTLEAAGLPVEQVFIFAVSKEEPFETGLFVLSPTALEVGQTENEAAIERFAECQESHKWPGPSQEVLALDLPDWYNRKF